jgi:hypothetical protein
MKDKLIKYFGKNRDKNVLYALLFVVFCRKYHWYEIKFIYRDKHTNNVLFHWYSQCGFTYQDAILNKREVKLTISPLHKRLDIHKRLLNNGYLDTEVNCYLGRFNRGLKNYI